MAESPRTGALRFGPFLSRPNSGLARRGAQTRGKHFGGLFLQDRIEQVQRMRIRRKIPDAKCLADEYILHSPPADLFHGQETAFGDVKQRYRHFQPLTPCARDRGWWVVVARLLRVSKVASLCHAVLSLVKSVTLEQSFRDVQERT